MDLASLTQTWTYPTKIHFSCGSSQKIGVFCEEAEILKPLVVVDQQLIKNNLINPIINSLITYKIPFELFAEFEENPTDESVSNGLKSFRKNNHDGLIAIGGGSTIDLAKAIAFMDAQSRPIFDFEDRFDWWRRANSKGIRRVIAIPTTAGTGSEVGRAAVIKDTKDLRKKLVFHPNMLPVIAILDAELTIGLPKQITAATGIDALVHNLESYLAPGYHPIADGVALEGLKLIKNNIEKVFQNGDNLNARCAMLVGSTMGAIAFQKGLGGIHALSHPIGSLLNSHHGLTNAILLRYVLAYNYTEVLDQLACIARYLNLEGGEPKSLVEWLINLLETLEMPNKLSSLGVDETHIPELTKMAINDQAAASNPKPLEASIVTSIYNDALQGKFKL